jgi:hypothetical protein
MVSPSWLAPLWLSIVHIFFLYVILKKQCYILGQTGREPSANHECVCKAVRESRVPLACVNCLYL